MLPIYYKLLLSIFLPWKYIIIGTVNQKTDETSDNDCLYPLNVFWDKYSVSIIK